jgi:hypothetical protein
MITKCFNPACKTPFDYRAGRLVRFSRKSTHHNREESYQFIEHFWLCSSCTDIYKFACEEGMPVGLMRREQVVSNGNLSYLVSAA